MIPYGRQSICPEDIQAVVDVLNSAYLTQGPKIPEFEKKISTYVKAPYAVAVNSATSALHIACLALGLEENDILWTSPISFVASANCALYCGAKVDFVDISPDTLNISIDTLKIKLIEAEKLGILPKILVVVHFAGRPAEMREICDLAKKYHFKIIEDASHALGAKYLGKYIGSCEYSEITVFSFHPVKIITTGEGGMITTKSEELYKKCQRLRSHGITREVSEYENQNPGGWYYEQVGIGFNYRITDIQAALGLSQMNRLNLFISKRNEFASRYINFFDPLSIKFQKNDVENNSDYSTISAYHLFVIMLPEKIKRDLFFKYMHNKGIGVNVHYIPIYHHPYYKKMGFKIGYCEAAEKYYQSCITLPLHPDMTENEFSYIQESILNYL